MRRSKTLTGYRTSVGLAALWLYLHALVSPSTAVSSQTTLRAPVHSSYVGTIPVLHVDVLARLPHDPDSYTQGLEMRSGRLYESTGLTGRSTIQVGELGRSPEHRVELPSDYFAEGITLVGKSLWQLTWRNQVAIRRDANSLSERQRVPYTGEGWGLCYQAPRARLVMSDGTSRLSFRDPETFALLGSVTVHANGLPVHSINELECVGNQVYANLLGSDLIACILPETGETVAYIDASSLLSPQERRSSGQLNGIAAEPGTSNLLLTGKNWPAIFRVKICKGMRVSSTSCSARPETPFGT